MKAKTIGIIGKKLGMTQLFDDGRFTGVTVIDFSGMRVVGYRTAERDGYNAVIVGYDFKALTRKDKTVDVPRRLREIRTDNVGIYENDQWLEALAGVKSVDVSGTSKGKGFAGTMKLFHFGGGPASHGSKRHRRPGSIGQHTWPSHVYRGKKMPRKMGNQSATMLSQKVVRVDLEKKLLFVRGTVPGSANGYVLVRDAIKG